MVSIKHKTRIVLFLLSAGLLIQAGYLLPGVGRSIGQIWNVLGKNALWRSAYFTQGKKFADYVVFLNENIPVGARVVLPPAVIDPKELSVSPLMQFFLMPRQVINCTELDCVQNLSPAKTYVLVVGEFPAGPPDPRFGDTLMFDKKWGLLLPEAAGVGDLLAGRNFESIFDILKAAIYPLLWLSLVGLCGLLLINVLLPEESWPFKASVGYGLGLTVLSWSAASVSLVGVKLTTTCYLVITAFMIASSAAVSVLKRRAAPGFTRDRKQARPAGIDGWLVVILLLGGIAALVSMGKGFSVSDEVLLWGVKGYAISAAGTLNSVMDWGTNTVYYPLHVPLVISAFRTLFMEELPASKLVFSGYFTALAILAYAYLSRQGWKRPAAGMYALLLAFTPLIFRHGTIAYANLALSFYLVAASMLLSHAVFISEPRAKTSRMFLSGLCFSAAAWTRPEGMLMAWLGIGLVLGLSSLKGRWKFTFGQIAAVVTPLVVYGLFWSWLKSQAYTQPAARANLAAGALGQVLAGNIHIQEAGYVLRTILSGLFQFDTWGVLGIVLVIFGVLYLIGRPGPTISSSFLVLAVGILYAAIIAGVYFIASYDTTHDIGWWVNTGLDRMLLPAVWLIWLGGVGSAQLFDHGKDRAASADF